MIDRTRPAHIHTLVLGTLLLTCLGHFGVARAQPGSCDPTKASCIPADGGGGDGGGSCTPAKAVLGLCTTGSGGGGSGGGGGAAPMCTAPPGGTPGSPPGSTPSCGGGPATTVPSGPSSGAGNPINLLNGNKYQEETDLPALPGVLGLELRRYYNSQSSHQGMLGANWRMSYEAVLYDFGGEIQILQADGRRLMFQRGLGAHAALCSSPQPQDGQVRIEPSTDGRGPATYHWRWANGRTLSFSGGSGGGFPLQAITEATGERLTLSYSPGGELTSIRDPQGRKLVFIYASAAEAAGQHRSRALKAIDTPLGRLTYTQDALGRLTAVGQARDATSAAFLARRYHYEDRYNGGHPLALTGISVRGADPTSGQLVEQRLSTYAYNADGLAILSTKGRPRELRDGKPIPDTGIEQIEIRYLDRALPGDTRTDPKTGEAIPTRLGHALLTNSLGAQTEVTSAVIGGHYRLIEMRGPGCSTCGPGDRRYGYDKRGLLISSAELDSASRPFRSAITELDKYGRPSRIGVRSYAGTKPQPIQWTERYDYADITYADGSIAIAPRPAVIARPSVISGKEHAVAMSYNDLGQVATIVETGFSPYGGNPQSGRSVAPLTRLTTYTYQRINERSVIKRIDGPLGQGDATQFVWDSDGNFVTAATSPGDLVTREIHDPATGRLSQRTDALGVVTRFAYSDTVPTKPSLVERAGQATRYEFDSLGRLIRIDEKSVDEGASGRHLDERSARGVELHYDVANRLISVTDAQGYKAQTTLDAEGEALVAGLYEPQQVLPLRATYRWYDDHRRLTKRLQADGRLDTWTYDQAGDVADHTDGDDVLHLLRTNAAGLQARVDLTPDGLIRAGLWNADGERHPDAVPHFAGPRVERDDFGRAAIEWRPEQGLTLRTYDAADHMLSEERLDQSAKAAGNVEQTFDIAGRLTRRLSFDVQRQPKQDMQRVYVGALLVQQRNDAQTTTYEHDASARVTATHITLNDAQGQPFYTTTLRTRYDSHGAPGATTLADGEVMRTERMATGVATRITLQSAFWSNTRDTLGRWFPPAIAHLLQRWLLETPILQDITFHPYNGLSGYTQGNGIATRKEFDLAGRLTALRVGASTSRFNYGVGPRIQEVADQAYGLAPIQVRYQYNGFGVLRPEAQSTLIKTGFNGAYITPRPTMRDSLGRTVDDGMCTYTFTENGQIDTVTMDGALLAKYRYNADAQRVSKTVLGASPSTVYYLWNQGKLVAEIEGSGTHRGEVSAQYLYLSNDGIAAPIAKVEGAWAKGNATNAARILFVQSDQRGEPTAMTNADRQVVWQARADAWGFVNPAQLHGQQAQMNLRLPGQYFDSETGLHDNWHRSYDARPLSKNHGRYLTPDPAGYIDGPDVYSYATGDPVNRADQTGLYEIDVHYYMTYFLAIAAGMKAEDAQTFSLAAQYVDDNPNTRPINWGSPLTQPSRLARYHFTLWKYADASHNIDHIVYNTSTDLSSPLSKSDQLTALRSYAVPDATAGACLAPTEQSLQFMGEFLHSFEDTYAHRDNRDVPIPINAGFGHASYGTDPDYTYDHIIPITGEDGRVVAKVSWNTNFARTLKMETDTYSQIVAYMTQRNFYASGRTSGKTISFAINMAIK